MAKSERSATLGNSKLKECADIARVLVTMVDSTNLDFAHDLVQEAMKNLRDTMPIND
jgi:hypothetical protein